MGFRKISKIPIIKPTTTMKAIIDKVVWENPDCLLPIAGVGSCEASGVGRLLGEMDGTAQGVLCGEGLGFEMYAGGLKTGSTHSGAMTFTLEMLKGAIKG